MGKAKTNRRTFDAKARKLYIEALKKGHSYRGASGAAGFSNRTTIQHRKDDPAFAEECEAAYEEGTQLLEEIAYKRIQDPEHKSDALIIFALKQRGWRDKHDLRVEAQTEHRVILTDTEAGNLGIGAGDDTAD